MHGVKILLRGQDSAGADEAAYLAEQRIERRKIDEGQRAQKEPARSEAVAPAKPRIEEKTQNTCRSALHRSKKGYSFLAFLRLPSAFGPSAFD